METSNETGHHWRSPANEPKQIEHNPITGAQYVMNEDHFQSTTNVDFKQKGTAANEAYHDIHVRPPPLNTVNYIREANDWLDKRCHRQPLTVKSSEYEIEYGKEKVNYDLVKPEPFELALETNDSYSYNLKKCINMKELNERKTTPRNNYNKDYMTTNEMENNYVQKKVTDDRLDALKERPITLYNKDKVIDPSNRMLENNMNVEDKNFPRHDITIQNNHWKRNQPISNQHDSETRSEFINRYKQSSNIKLPTEGRLNGENNLRTVKEQCYQHPSHYSTEYQTIGNYK
ncbi:hypothetical protein SNEBB_002966 [Seison nebaliae]|nr:hypothetical protein SNEBB_002966 [Seison nebaliae]